MLIRFRADMCVPEKNLPMVKALYNHAEAVMANAVEDLTSLDPIEHIGEPTYIEIQKCYHDEAKPNPCKVIERIEV